VDYELSLIKLYSAVKYLSYFLSGYLYLLKEYYSELVILAEVERVL